MVALLRSTDGNPDSRFEKYVDFLEEKDVPYFTICWDRRGNKQPLDNKYYYKRASEYGKRYGNVLGLIGFNRYIFKVLWKNRKKYEVIHACDFDTIIPAILIRILLRKKVIYDVFDWYVDSRSVKGLIKWMIYGQEYLNIKLSEAVIICEEERRQQIIFTPKQLWVLPNIPNFKEQPNGCNNNQRLTLGYVGILTTGRGLENLIRFAKEEGSIDLHIGGFGELETLLTDVSQYDNIKYYGSVPYAQALEILYASDIIYAMYQKTNRNHILAAPNKYYEGLFLGKPIITTMGTIVGDKTLKFKTGFVIEESYQDLVSLISSLSESSIQECGIHAKELWNSKYSTYVSDFLERTYLPFINQYRIDH